MVRQTSGCFTLSASLPIFFFHCFLTGLLASPHRKWRHGLSLSIIRNSRCIIVIVIFFSLVCSASFHRLPHLDLLFFFLLSVLFVHTSFTSFQFDFPFDLWFNFFSLLFFFDCALFFRCSSSSSLLRFFCYNLLESILFFLFLIASQLTLGKCFSLCTSNLHCSLKLKFSYVFHLQLVRLFRFRPFLALRPTRRLRQGAKPISIIWDKQILFGLHFLRSPLSTSGVRLVQTKITLATSFALFLPLPLFSMFFGLLSS